MQTREISCPLSGIEPRLLSLPVCILVTTIRAIRVSSFTLSPQVTPSLSFASGKPSDKVGMVSRGAHDA
jgi:hypothetical protein